MQRRGLNVTAIKKTRAMLWFFLEDKSLKQVFNWLHSGLGLQVGLELVLAFARRQLQVRPE